MKGRRISKVQVNIEMARVDRGMIFSKALKV